MAAAVVVKEDVGLDLVLIENIALGHVPVRCVWMDGCVVWLMSHHITHHISTLCWPQRRLAAHSASFSVWDLISFILKNSDL